MSLLNRYLTDVENAAFSISKLALFAMMVLITLNTLGRYLLGFSISWSIPVIETYLMVAIVFFSAARVQQMGGNVSTTVFARHLPDTIRRYALAVTNLVTIVFIAVMVRGTALVAFSRWESGATTTGVVGLPTAYSWAFVSLGFALVALRLAQESVSLILSPEAVEEVTPDSEIEDAGGEI